MGNIIEIWEILLLPVYVIIGLASSLLVRQRKYRRIFLLAISARMLGALFFALIYMFYYQGGDTFAYFDSAVPFNKLILTDFFRGISISLQPYSIENQSVFTSETGFPHQYICGSGDTFTVVKVLIPMIFLSFRSYLLTTLTISVLTFIGPWKLFLTFEKMVPDFTNKNAFATLFFPSILFWGGGISKDTITFSATCLLVYGVYEILIRRKFNPLIALTSGVALFLVIQIKPYIFVSILPGILLWYFSKRIASIKNQALRWSIAPLVVAFSGVIFAALYSQLGQSFGEYSPDQIIQKAIVTQEDLKRDYYGGNSFDIGTIEPSIVGVLSKFPLATFYGLFGPTMLNVNNIVMLFSAVENSYLLIITILILFFRNPFTTLSQTLDKPLLVFCLTFSVLFAFAIGLSTPNFGALVRFKIPILPFLNLYLLSIYFRKQISLQS